MFLIFWLRNGTGNTKRFIPIHEMYNSLGDRLCSTIIKAHILTGCDVTSKIGTKDRAIKASPEKFLHKFAENEFLTAEDIRLSEQYLLKVLFSSSNCKSFDDLRVECYKQKKISLVDLQPTSCCIQYHILRCYYTVKLQTT